MKRILILGVAALAFALLAVSFGTQVVSGQAVAQAQTPPATDDPADPADPADPPEAPDTEDAEDPADPADPPEAPDAADEPDAPDAPDAPEDDQGDDEGDDESDSDSGSPTAPGSQSTPNAGPGTLPVVQGTTRVADTDNGTVPQGGIQAGAGGTAGDGTGAALLLGSGAVVLLLMAGGLALRRRGLES